MKFIKTHKTLFAVILVLLIMLIGVIILLVTLVGKVGNDAYGDRLDGIENYEIDKSQVSTLKEDIGALDSVSDVTYDLEGRLVNVIITVDSSLALDTAKTYADKVLEYFDDDQKTYYDIQVYLTTTDESDTYPVIGYKNKTSDSLVWKQ